LNPYPNKPKVTFKPDGTFKLTVFSDLHLGENPWEDWGPAHDKNTTALLRQILADEKPDYACVHLTSSLTSQLPRFSVLKRGLSR